MPSAHIFKYAIIGDPGVGKTCLSLQFTDRTFQTAYEATDDIEFGARTVTVDDKPIRLHVWDTAGRGALPCVIRPCYREAACIILVYDITRRDTFNRISIWLEEARKESKEHVTWMLVGNKCDLSNVRAVSYEEGQKFARKHNLLFMEASAKTTHNVDEAFVLTAETLCKKIEDGVDLSEKCVGFLRGPGNTTPSEHGGVAGSSPWRLLTKFRGFIHSFSFLPKFMGFIDRLGFLPNIMGFIHRLSFLPKLGTTVRWWPFCVPHVFGGHHNLPKVFRKSIQDLPLQSGRSRGFLRDLFSEC